MGDAPTSKGGQQTGIWAAGRTLLIRTFASSATQLLLRGPLPCQSGMAQQSLKQLPVELRDYAPHITELEWSTFSSDSKRNLDRLVRHYRSAQAEHGLHRGEATTAWSKASVAAEYVRRRARLKRTHDATTGVQSACLLPEGWQCCWSGEYKRWYYCNALQGVTQWEPPATPIKSIVPYPDSEEESEEQEHEEAAAEEDHATAETMTPLMIAATAGEAEQLGLLLEGATAATLRETDGQGRTALHLACLSGSVECVTQLVSAGADVTLLTNAGDGCIALARQANLARKTRQLLLPPIQMTERQAVRTSTAAALQEAPFPLASPADCSLAHHTATALLTSNELLTQTTHPVRSGDTRARCSLP